MCVRQELLQGNSAAVLQRTFEQTLKGNAKETRTETDLQAKRSTAAVSQCNEEMIAFQADI